jgi:hypothetical protein
VLDGNRMVGGVESTNKCITNKKAHPLAEDVLF